jgi:hypothetical protein
MIEKETKPGVFIIESLRFDDEERNYFEGEVISKILNFSDIPHEYHYIRTVAEFEHFIGKFQESGYRYLHISCHGNADCIATTLDTVPFNKLSIMLAPVLDKKRLFVSACSATNDRLASEIFGVTECNSIIGPHKDINMDDAVIFWSSFYSLMFKKNNLAMKRDILEETIKNLSKLHEIPISYYTISRSSDSGWKKVELK